MADGLNRLRNPQFLAWRLPWLVISLLLGAIAVFGAILQPPIPDRFEPVSDAALLGWLRYPIEHNPHLRLPFISRDLHSVALSADGRIGVAVGENGTILKTTSSGNTWSPRASGVSEALNSIALSDDGRIGVAVGENGTILKTTNSGNTWSPRASGTLESLRSVAISPDGSWGLAVGDNGTTLRTADGGNAWQASPPVTSAALTSVAVGALIDSGSEEGWAVGDRGTILHTTNSGHEWKKITSDTSENLTSMAMSDNLRTGLVVGENGTILRTTNFGIPWEKPQIDGSQNIASVAIHRDERTGLAVGMRGTILRTEDAGDKWGQHPSGTSESLTSVAIGAERGTGLAVGLGVVLITVDAGETWRLLSPEDDYRKYPAPWTWCAFALALLSLLPVLRPSPLPPAVAEGIPDYPVSDRPIETAELDTLQRRPIADTLSRFLRNENTEPPVTIAVTGNWGEGKSSLMNLVKAELEKNGTRTVWFNAWHHQKEEHLFAALLQAVRDQAIPSILSAWMLRGLGFRWRLVASRARRHRFWTIAALALAGISIGALFTVPDRTFFILQSVLRLNFGELWEKETIPLISSVLSLFIAYQGFVATLKRSGVNPGRLLTAASGTFRVKAFGDQLGFRHRFGEAFNEVAEALRPNTLLILIDDLDRCRPEQVVATLEAINFLVSAGPCYIVMGIAPEQVMYCVGLGFKEIAAERAEAPGDGQDPEIQARDARRDFARNYLEKLVNIEVPIPKLTDEGAGRLVEPVSSSGNPLEIRRAFWHFVGRLAAFAGVLAILGAGIYVGTGMYRNVTTSSDQGQRPAATPPSTTPSLEPSPTPDPNEGPTSQSPEPSGDGNGNFRPSAEERVPWWIPLSAAGLLALAMLAVIALYAWRRQEDRIQDSPAFTKALNIWHPLVRARTNSPRQMKRFINRVRYLAMASSVTPDRSVQQPSESLIVALAALQSINIDVAAENSVGVLTGLFKDPNNAVAAASFWSEMTTLEMREKELIQKAFADHHDQIGSEEVTEEILSQLHKMASGIVVR